MIRYKMLALIVLVGCSAKHDGPTEFMGEPMYRGSNETTLVRTIDHPPLTPVFAMYDNGKESIQIFQKSSGMPYVNVTDWNGDGVFDYLNISVLDQDGTVVVEIEDFQMDGQPDLRMWHDGQAEVFYENVWRAVLGDSSFRYIEVDGQTLELPDVLAELGRP